MPEKPLKRTRTNRRSRFLVGLLTGAATLVVLPMAIAWACAPSTGQIDFNKTAFSAGQTVEVWGSGFARSNPVVLTLQSPSGSAQRVAPDAVTTPSGYFETSFVLPAGAAPGNYALQARTDEPSIGEGHAPTRPTTATLGFKVLAPPGARVSPTPVLVAPLVTGPAVVDNRAARSRAIRRCKKRYLARRSASTTKKRTLRRKRAACIGRAKKRYPLAPSL